MDGFNPEEWGYNRNEVKREYGVWVIAEQGLPVIIDIGDGAWYCPTPLAYEQAPQMRALFA